MTAEVVAMNKEGVALAADSAVTFSGSKIFTTAEKLFMLAPNHAVGVLIYNNADFMDLPWSVLVRLYRDKLVEGNKAFETLEEYAEDFVKFLTLRGESIFPEEQQAITFQKTIDRILNDIFRRFWLNLTHRYSEGIKLDDEKISELITESVDFFHATWRKFPDIHSPIEDVNLQACLLEKYRTIIETRRNLVFEQLPLTDKNKQKIEEACIFLFTKAQELPNFTGVVFAGYGISDLFPQAVHLLVENVLCGKLKFMRKEKVGIGFNQPIATIMPLAQDDIVNTVLGGVHPIFLNHLEDELLNHMQEEDVDALLERVTTKMQEEYTNSIMMAVAALPKAELAIIAETLVSTTSFMRKHSMDIESVGGVTDVAVITKKDGFIWIKRKHYFDVEYNQHFLRR